LKKITTTTHIAITLTSVVVTLLFLAVGIGLVPNKIKTKIQTRYDLCENLSIQLCSVAHENIINTLETLAPHIIKRNKDLLSMGFRNDEGKLISASNTHDINWKPLTNNESTPTQIQIPIYKGDKQLGSIEMFFAPVYPKTIMGFFEVHYIFFVIFMAASTFAVYWIYLKKTLRHLDPSSVIPTRVKAVLDNLTESVVILDKSEQIIFTNKAFCTTTNQSEDKLTGRKLSLLPWIQPQEKQEHSDLPWIQTLRKGYTRTNIPLILEGDDGNKRISIVNTVPILAANGEYRGIMASFTDVTELEEKNNELVKMSRSAGMAEIATNVLHNIGNILNNVNVSATNIHNTLSQSKLLKLHEVAEMIKEHEKDISTFLSEDPKGKHIPIYITKTTKILLDEHKEITETIQSLRNNIEHIKTAIRLQQNYAKTQTCEEITSIREIVEDAIKINKTVLEYQKIDVIREFGDIDYVNIDRSRILQVIANLIKNAADAVKGSDVKQKHIAIKCDKSEENQLRIEIVDNGTGIAPENITKIFQHGYTTKAEGHGFGLHGSAISAKEMGGTLVANSEGKGLGASFMLTLPLKLERRKNGKRKQENAIC